MVVKRKKESKKERQTWTCPICDEENSSDEDICQGCGSLREEPAYNVISDEQDME